ncbi:MAG: hypothetical protein RML40_02615 [Bacteroidota bacterium]|nr:hypothetical protein [Candidatus Kapabacteria bacterium]MDW8219403.1 hypothetical protein [Bacteroidota bacterium]
MLLFACWSFNSAAQHSHIPSGDIVHASITGGSLGKDVNASKEDYASWVIFAQAPGAFDTLFFTSSRPLPTSLGIVRKDRTASVFYAVRDPDIRRRNLRPINEGWSGALPYQNIGTLNRATHGATIMLAGGRAILAGERNISVGAAIGTSYMLDLFELYTVSYSRYDEAQRGPTNLTRIMTFPIDAANTDSTWESQPTVLMEGGANLPTYGKTLFFVSNRPEFPGDSTDDMNIWFVQRNLDNSWSTPKLVPGINTPGDEISPHCGVDGHFYFATNWDYASNKPNPRGHDIYRCDYRDSAGILLPIKPINLDEALTNDVRNYGKAFTHSKGSGKHALESLPRINSDSDDCFPFITPDGQYLFLTSNRKGSEDLDLYAFSLPKPRIRLRVKVFEQETDAEGKLIGKARLLEGVSVRVRDVAKNTVLKLPSSKDECFLEPDKTYELSLDTLFKEHCYTNSLKGDEIILVKTVQPRSADTLHQREFTIIKQHKPMPRLEFVPTAAMAFFITGYWKPTTRENLEEFRERHKIGFFRNAVFVDSTDLRAEEAEAKGKRGVSTVSTPYRTYDDVASVIDEQFEKEFGKLADALSKVEQLRFWENRVNCGGDTLMLKMTVRGYTDRRGLRDGYYNDVSVIGKDRTGRIVLIPTGDRIMRQTSALLDSGQRGNVKLSILRAWFMAEAFHRFMMRRDSARNIYRWLFENGRVLPPEIIGMGIDKERFAQTGDDNDLYSRRIEMNFELVRKGSSSMLTQTAVQHSAIQADTLSAILERKSLDSINVPETIPSNSAVGQGTAAQNRADTLLTGTSHTVTLQERQYLSPLTLVPWLNLSTQGRKDSLASTDATPSTQPNSTLVSIAPERCYTILYTSIEGNKQEALRLRDLLVARNVRDARVDVYISPIGKRFYRVCSGCFSSDYEAFDFLKTLPPMREVLNIATKPVVIRM